MGVEETGDDAPPPRHRKLLEITNDDAIIEGDLDEAGQLITDVAARVLDVPRVNIWLFSDDREHLQCLDHYDRRTDTHESGATLAVADYPAYVEALESHRSLAAPDAMTDSRTSELAASYLEPNDVHSLLDATIRDEGEVVGVVCHEATDARREWTDTEVELATQIAGIAYRALRNHQQARQRDRLEFQQSLLRAQQEAIPDGLLVVSTDGDVLSYNDQFREFWGLSDSFLESATREELGERLVAQFDDQDAIRRHREKLSADPTTKHQSTFELTDGRVIETHSRPVERDDGETIGRLLMVRDITARRERQQNLELADRAIEEAPIGITISDPTDDDNPMVYVNDQFQALTGYDEDESLGRNCRFLQGEGTDERPVREMRAAIEAQEPVTVDLRNYRKDGSEFWNRVSIAPVEDDDGAVTNFVGFQQDVTDQIEATRQMRVLHRVLRHNLANQMTVVRGTAERLADVTTGDRREAARTIVSECDRLLSVTDTHRAIVELLHDRPAPEPLAIDELVDRAVETAREAFPSASISVEADTGLAPVGIPALEAAVGELVTNAVVHGPADRPQIDVEVRAGEDEVVVRIVDDGPGLPAEEAAILEGTQDVDPLYHGQGMGMWFVYWVVTLSGGTVTVAEREPSGTRIDVALRQPDRAASPGD